MSEIANTPNSPFDALMREDGRWSARDLQGLMGYSRWEDFKRIVERAKQSAANSGHDADSAFAAITEHVVTRGNAPDVQRLDYHLSRMGAYLTAMNGDPNKAEVAAAQAYFATKTREAEVQQSLATVPQTYAQALRAAADAAEAQERAELEAAQTREALAITTPKAEVYDEWLESDAIEMTDFAKRIGFTPPTRFTKTLREIGVLRKDKTHTGRYRNLPTRTWEESFDVRPTQIPTGEWVDLALVNTQGQVDLLEELRNEGLI